MLPADLIRIAELIKLAAQTAKAFSDSKANGEQSIITEIAIRIEAAAEKLADVGRMMTSGGPLLP